MVTFFLIANDCSSSVSSAEGWLPCAAARRRSFDIVEVGIPRLRGPAAVDSERFRTVRDYAWRSCMTARATLHRRRPRTPSTPTSEEPIYSRMDVHMGRHSTSRGLLAADCATAMAALVAAGCSSRPEPTPRARWPPVRSTSRSCRQRSSSSSRPRASRLSACRDRNSPTGSSSRPVRASTPARP